MTGVLPENWKQGLSGSMFTDAVSENICAVVVLGSIAVHQVGRVGLHWHQEILYREAAEGALQYDKIDSLANLIVEHGVPCIIVAANDGDSGLFYINGGASGKGVMAVASLENIEAPLISYHSSYTIDGGRKIDFLYTPRADVQWGVSMPLYATSLDYHVGDDACQPRLANTPGLIKYLVLVRRGTCSYDDKLRNLVAKGAQYVMLYNDEPDMVTMIADDPIVVNATGMVSPEIGADWVRLLKDGRKLTINGLDGSVLPMPYQVWIISSHDKEKATRSPDGFTYVVPKAGTSNGFEVLPTLRVILALGSTLMHANIVPLQNGTIATHNATAKSVGEPFGLPSQLNEMGVAMFPLDGKLESGSYAPKGRYRFLVRALRGCLAMPPST
ncbi:hypothetical protein E4U61_006260 [Claviceps capensis]|nr:hypothetical protein E4U61_006260 [Claviceps capensis]